MPSQLVPVPMLGGVNLLADPRRIGDGQLTWAKNLVPVDFGIPGSRGTASSIVNNTWPLNVYAGARAPRSMSAGYVVGHRSFISGYLQQGIYVFDDQGTTALATHSYTNPPQYRPVFVPFNEKVYVFAGYPEPGSGKIVQKKGNGDPEIVDFTFQGTNNGGIHPAGAALYRKRMVFFNFGPGYESDLIMSDPYDPTLVGNDLLSANSRRFSVGAGDGDRIVGCKEIMLTAVGSPAQSALLILKRFSAYLLTGEFNNVADSGSNPLGDAEINRISVDCGCASPETIVTTPYGTLWASHDDVWFFAQGQVPVRVGSAIRPALKWSPADKQYLWHAAYHNGFYRLAVFGQGQGPSEDSPCKDQWWFDLRGGLEQASWWGPQQFKNIWPDGIEEPEHGTRIMFSESWANTEPRLFGTMTYNTGSGAASLLVDFDGPGNRDQENSANAFDEETLRGTEVATELHTKEYDFGDPMVDKMFQGIELNVYADNDEGLEIEALMDGGRDVVTKTGTLSNNGFILDTDTVGGELAGTLKLHYKLEATGSVADETGNYPGSILGNVPTQITGTDGFGWNLAGNNTQVRVGPGNIPDLHEGIRFSCQVRVTLPLSQSKNCLFCHFDRARDAGNGASGEIFGVYLLSDGRVQVQWDSAGGNPATQHTVITDEVVDTGVWNKISCTRYPDGTVEIRINEALVKTGSGTPIAWTTTSSDGVMDFFGTDVPGFTADAQKIAGDFDEVKVEQITGTVATVVDEGGLFTREFQSIDLRPSEDERPIGKTIQVKLRTDGDAAVKYGGLNVDIRPFRRRT